MVGIVEVVQDNIMSIENVIGFIIYALNGSVKHKYIPKSVSLEEMDELGRELVIMWDALRKSGIKEGMVNWKYKEALIYMNSFSEGFLLAICNKDVNENNLIKVVEKSTDYLMGADFDYEDWVSSLSARKEEMVNSKSSEDDNIDAVIAKIKGLASKIAGPWIEYYFDGILENWLDRGKPRKYRLKELVSAVSEYIDEENARKKFEEESQKLIT